MHLRRWQEVQRAFADARSLPTAERGLYLDRMAQADASLGREVRSLLQSDEQACDFLVSPLARLVDPETEGYRGSTSSECTFRLGEEEHLRSQDPSLGCRVGPYRLRRRLGGGGMGTVYLADRDDATYRGQVAIKMLRRALGSDVWVGRFESERQILADLQHPGIARLLDGGATEDGRPYLVMEYVEGLPIDRFCQLHDLKTEERLGLILRVASAVSFAHRNLVIHRDLKPQNVLVTKDGEPKLLDFGIAKLLRSDLGVDSAPVAVPQTTGPAAMTFEYASPEQLLRKPVSTATDVYSLGVVLYELLAGTRPFCLADRPLDEWIRDVCERSPTAPSVAVIRAVPSTGVRDRRPSSRRLAGDLDTIVLKALAKEPERRYRSVDDLTRDIERHLEGLPVRARPNTLAYRCGKFLRRRRWTVAVGLSMLCVVVVFVMTLAASQSKTLTAYERSEAAKEFVLSIFAISDPDPLISSEVPGFLGVWGEGTTAREILDYGRRNLVGRFEDQPLLRAELTAALGRIYLHLAMHDEAGELLHEALDLLLEMPSREANTVASVRRLLGEYYLEMGDYPRAEDQYQWVLRGLDGREARSGPVREAGLAGLAAVRRAGGELEEAEALQVEALNLARRHQSVASGSPFRPMTDEDRVARHLHALAEILRERGALSRAEETYGKALTAYRKLHGDRHPKVADVLDDLGLLNLDLGHNHVAVSRFEEALILRRQIYVGDHPEVAETLHNLASALRNVDRRDEAAELALESLRMRREIFGEDHPRVALSTNLLGLLATDRGEARLAEGHFRKAHAIWQEQLGAEHYLTASAHSSLGEALRNQRRYEEAEGHYRRALAIYREVYGEDGAATAKAHSNLASVLWRQGGTEDAVIHRRTALDILRRRFGDDHRDVAIARMNLGVACHRHGALAEAEQQLRLSIDLLTRSLGAPHRYVALCETNLAEVLRDQRRFEEAEVRARNALEGYRQTLADGHSWILRAQGVLAESLVGLGRFSEAETLLAESLILAREHHGTEGSATRRMTILRDELVGG